MFDEDKKSWIYAGGLPYELTEGDIICVFSQYGEIVEISLSRDKETGKSRGFGFIKYEDHRSCELAVDNLNMATVVGRKIKVSHANNVNAVRARKPAPVSTQEQPNEGTLLPQIESHKNHSPPPSKLLESYGDRLRNSQEREKRPEKSSSHYASKLKDCDRYGEQEHRHREKELRHRDRSRSPERSRRDRSRSRERKHRERSRSRDRGHRNRSRSRERKVRDGSKSRGHSHRDRSKSKERGRHDRPKSRDRKHSDRRDRSRERVHHKHRESRDTGRPRESERRHRRHS